MTFVVSYFCFIFLALSSSLLFCSFLLFLPSYLSTLMVSIFQPFSHDRSSLSCAVFLLFLVVSNFRPISFVLCSCYFSYCLLILSVILLLLIFVLSSFLVLVLIIFASLFCCFLFSFPLFFFSSLLSRLASCPLLLSLFFSLFPTYLLLFLFLSLLLSPPSILFYLLLVYISSHFAFVYHFLFSFLLRRIAALALFYLVVSMFFC